MAKADRLERLDLRRAELEAEYLAALIAALEAGRLAGAALDVFDNEPHVPEALRKNPRVVLTPHMASATVETRTRMADVVLENLDAFVGGAALSTAAV